MNSSQNQSDKSSKLNKIREIVTEDLQRIQLATSAFAVLNSHANEAMEVIEERYDKYERFYRPENFQRLGDIDLTRKALNIRKQIGHAIEEIRTSDMGRPTRENFAVDMGDVDVNSLVDEDDRVMGELYFRDAMTYIQLGDLNEAYSLLQRSIGYNAYNGLSQAYLGYMTFKRRAYISNAIEEARGLLDRAARLDSKDCDIFVLRGRFFARMGELDALEDVIAHIESIDPTHSTLDRLQRKARQLRG